MPASSTTNGRALERPDHVPGDPAAVEAARLSPRPFVVDEAGIHQRWVERDHPRQLCIRGIRCRVAPRRASHDPIRASDRVVARLPLPLAPARPVVGDVHPTGAIGARAISGDAIAEMIQRRAASAGFTDAQVDRSTRPQTGTYAPFN